MNPKANASGNKGKAQTAAGIPKARKVTEQRGGRWQADREKRQELARLRHEASLDQGQKPGNRHKLVERERLQGKGLFYCSSPAARAQELQRRLREANVENMTESRPRRQGPRG